MRKRFLYALLFGVPGLPVALLIAFAVFGAAAGALWIFVYGDNPWPASAEKLLPVLFVAGFLAVWLLFVIAGYSTGKKLESNPDLNFRHIAVSAVATIVPVVLIALHQLGVGNIGPKSATVQCSEYCRAKGYAASGMPPKNSGISVCSCFDDRGREAVKVPLDSMAAGAQQ